MIRRGMRRVLRQVQFARRKSPSEISRRL